MTTVGEDSEIRLCECVYDLSALAVQTLGSNGAEIDSRDLFHHILNWSREFEEGGFEHEDYMTAVIEFGKLKIAEYKEGLAQSLEAEEAEEPEKPAPTDAELTFALASAAPEDREEIYQQFEAIGISREAADTMAAEFRRGESAEGQT